MKLFIEQMKNFSVVEQNNVSTEFLKVKYLSFKI